MVVAIYLPFLGGSSLFPVPLGDRGGYLLAPLDGGGADPPFL